jgi:hypothetical protein
MERALAFGSEEGRLHILPDEMADRVYSLPATTEAVNGVAFSGKHVAVTSRDEVFVGTADDVKNPDRLRRHSFNAGAHGVVASRSGIFLAPMGGDGFYQFAPGPAGEIQGLIASSPEHSLVFQKMVRLGDTAAGEVFVCALRSKGLVAVTLRPGEMLGPFIGPSRPGLDVVDVCALNDPRFPLAAVGVSRRGAIVFSRDATADEGPRTLQFTELQGTAYSILAARGHLLLLTDRALHVFEDLASRLLAGEDPIKDVAVATMACEGSDAFLLREDAVLIAEDGKVLRFEVDALVSNSRRRGDASSQPTPSAHPTKDVELESHILRTMFPCPESSGTDTRDISLTLTPA